MLYNAPIFYVIDERVKVISIEEETGSKNIVINMFWFRKYINKQKPNLILSFSAPFNMLALSSLLWTKHKVVACERVDPKSFRWGKPLEFIRNLLYERADGILTQTQMSKDYFVGDLLKKTDIIYNPIEMSKEYLGAALSINKQNLIVTAARLVPQKRQDLLICCFARFKKEHPDYKLTIFGTGPEKENLIRCAEANNVADAIDFPGTVKDLWNRIKYAKMFVMTSLFEGMSNSMIEAMCLGLPIISTRVSGAVDLIKNQESGILIDINDSEALYRGMCKIADDEEFARKLGRNAMGVYGFLNVDSISNKWVDYIDSHIR